MRLAPDCQVNKKNSSVAPRASVAAVMTSPSALTGALTMEEKKKKNQSRCPCTELNALIDSGCKRLTHTLPSPFSGDISSTERPRGKTLFLRPASSLLIGFHFLLILVSVAAVTSLRGDGRGCFFFFSKGVTAQKNQHLFPIPHLSSSPELRPRRRSRQP